METKTNMLGTMKEGKLLLKMSLPTIASMLIAALYNIVDAIFVGQHAEATLGLGGLSVAFPIQLLLISIGQLFGMGAASLFSRNVGEGKIELGNKTVGNAFFGIAAASVILTVVGALYTSEIIRLMGAAEEILPLAAKYARIILLGSLLHLFVNASTHIVRAEGSALLSMIFMSAGSLLNIPLDYLFVLGLDMGVAGAAIATVISTGVSCLLFALYIFSKKSAFKFNRHCFNPKFSLLLKTMGVGFPGFAIHVLGIAVMLVINLSIRPLGVPSLYAVTGVINRIMGIVIMPISGIMFGLLPIVSFNYGAGNVKRILKSIRLSILISTGFCVVCFAVLMLFSGLIVQAFISIDDAAYATAVKSLRIVNILLPFVGICVLTSGICQGLGEIKYAALSSVCKNILLIIMTLAFVPSMGFLGIIWAFPIADAFAIIAVIWILLKTIKGLKVKQEMILKTVD